MRFSGDERRVQGRGSRRILYVPCVCRVSLENVKAPCVCMLASLTTEFTNTNYLKRNSSILYKQGQYKDRC